MRKNAPHKIDVVFNDVDGMTLADWRARAALIGMNYYREAHYFYRVPSDIGPTDRFDPDTMEPITMEQARSGPTLFYADGTIVPEAYKYDRVHHQERDAEIMRAEMRR